MKDHGIKRRMFAVFMGLVMALSLVIATAPQTASASSSSSANEEVMASQVGVLQIKMLYRNDNNAYEDVTWGSAFLINDNTIVTCAHVVTLSDSELQSVADAKGKTVAEVKDRLSYEVTIKDDVSISAALNTKSDNMDWAVLTLSQSIQDRSPLTIRTSEVQQTEMVYAIGFPMESILLQAINDYSYTDSTITSGVVNKVGLFENAWSGENTKAIQSSCKMVSGNSGGPLVDANGYVIGICQAYSSEDYYYAVSIDQVTEVLDSLGIAYTAVDAAGELSGGSASITGDTGPAEETEAEPEVTEPEVVVDKTALDNLIDTAEGYKADEYTEESFADLSAALDGAIEVADNADATQTEVDKALSDLQVAMDALEEAPQGLSTATIIIIASAAVIILIIIILIVAMSSKKKKSAAKGSATVPAPNPYQQGMPQQSPYAPQGQTQAQPQGGFRPVQPAVPTAPAASGVGETTVLDQGSGETTVLSQKVSGGTLTRKSNGEQIEINAEEFVIGRERSKVNYCVSNNSSVGRTHAKIVVRNAQAYLVDLNATNGTFLNGVRCAARTENALKTGDKITLSDEEFTYRA